MTSLIVTCAAGLFTLGFLVVERLTGLPDKPNPPGPGQSSGGDVKPPEPYSRPISLVKVEGDGATFAVLTYQNFAVRAIDESGNPATGIKVEWTTPVGGDKAYVNITSNDGRSSATNLYTFPNPGPYEQVAAVAAPDTQVGFSSTSTVKVVGPTVKFVFHQQLPVSKACADGEYKEGNAMAWNLSNTSDGLQLKRTDGGCWANLVSDGTNWKGTLQCSNGASYPVVVMPNEGCTELSSSLSWFKLTK